MCLFSYVCVPAGAFALKNPDSPALRRRKSSSWAPNACPAPSPSLHKQQKQFLLDKRETPVSMDTNTHK